MNIYRFILFSLLSLPLALGVVIVSAQEQPNTGGETASPSSWITKCTSEGRKATLDCSVEQTVVLTKTQQLLLSVFVRVPPDTRRPAMMIHLPLGLYLPAGVMLELKGQKTLQLEIQSCDLKGCYAGTAVSNRMLASMKRNQQLTIAFQDLPKNNITVPVPLKGFTKAYQKIQ